MIIDEEKREDNRMFLISRKMLFLLKLASYEGKQPFVISDLEEFVGDRSSQPDYREICKLLKDKGIIFFVDRVFNHDRFKINQKLLRDFIDDLIITEEFYNYFNKYHHCVW